jgi:predicted  nucleic acid-binding Zn-ribbon protein
MSLRAVPAAPPGQFAFAQLTREQLERQFADIHEELVRAQAEIRSLNGRISRLELDLAEAELDEEVFDWIADLRRGLLTLEELYERTLA